MFEALLQGFLSVLSLQGFVYMIIGVILGIVFGILPGIGGMAAIAMLLPLIWGMKAEVALILILALSCATSQGGSITAVLINVPGEGTNAATLLDGYPMAQQGKAGRALGAVLCAGALGGIFGGVVMIALIPVVRPMVLSFSSAELFFTILLGISFVTAITDRQMARGIVGGGIGILLALVGYQNTTGLPRFTLGTLYLEDGIKMIPLMMGLFAFPEVIDMALEHSKISRVEGTVAKIGSDLFEGVKDVFRHWWLFIRCSVIGTIVGIIPGVGAQVATFVCYGHAKQTSKHPEMFGTGIIEGVIAPESASNAKEGGALLTTLAFGIPGSAEMALILAAFLVVGITPGPKMLEEHLSLSFALAWTTILSNVISSIILLVFARQFVKITFVDSRIIVPAVIIFASIGAYAIGSNMNDVLTAFLVTIILGYWAKHLGYNRACIILGYVLGELAENYFLISLKAYGVFFPLRPICLILIAIIIFGLSYTTLAKLWRRREA